MSYDLFLIFKKKTAYELRIIDWSSDVCSSDLMAERKVLPYLDVPFQHASTRVLKAMKRPAASEDTLKRIRAWRSICPDLSIRSSSEERRVGKEWVSKCRSRWWPATYKKKKTQKQINKTKQEVRKPILHT